MIAFPRRDFPEKPKGKRVVEAEAFILKDSDGRSKAVLTTDDTGSPYLLMRVADSVHPNFVIQTRPDGSVQIACAAGPAFLLSAKPDCVAITVLGEEPSGAAMMAYSVDDGPVLRVEDRTGKVLFETPKGTQPKRPSGPSQN